MNGPAVITREHLAPASRIETIQLDKLNVVRGRIGEFRSAVIKITNPQKKKKIKEEKRATP